MHETSRAPFEGLTRGASMKRSVAVLGAGGKMGFRVTKKLVDAGYDVRAVEIAPPGQARLGEAGIKAMGVDDGLNGAEVVVLAVPVNVIGRVVHELAPKLSAGTIIVILDAAA